MLGGRRQEDARVSEPESQAPLDAGSRRGTRRRVARRLAFYQRAGGIVTPVLTAVSHS